MFVDFSIFSAETCLFLNLFSFHFCIVRSTFVLVFMGRGWKCCGMRFEFQGVMFFTIQVPSDAIFYVIGLSEVSSNFFANVLIEAFYVMLFIFITRHQYAWFCVSFVFLFAWYRYAWVCAFMRLIRLTRKQKRCMGDVVGWYGCEWTFWPVIIVFFGRLIFDMVCWCALGVYCTNTVPWFGQKCRELSPLLTIQWRYRRLKSIKGFHEGADHGQAYI